MEFIFSEMRMNRNSLEIALRDKGISISKPNEIIDECIQFLSEFPDGDFRINNKKITSIQENKRKRDKNE